MYGLLTKCEVKMAGYWPSSFLREFMDRDGYMALGVIFLEGQGG